MMERKIPGPAIMVIFGGGGDLAWRKLVPALYNLFIDGWLPEEFAVFGIDIKKKSIAEFRKRLKDGVDRFSRRGKAKDKDWKHFSATIAEFISADFGDKKTYRELSEKLSALEKKWGVKAHRIFYLAIPPMLVETITNFLGEAGLALDRDRARIVVEKPFGRDLASAKALNRKLTTVFDEIQIYRIDHYLGKETVQNILAFRFANALFEPIWDRRYIDHVQITVAEDVGVGHRGGYYDKTGALRDMVQNHLLQILCLIAMEPPVSFDADEIRNKKVDVLRAIRAIKPEEVHDVAVRGQYGPGKVRRKKVRGYRHEENVSPESITETFAALKLHVDNWRWHDVPFYLRTGKRMPRKVSEAWIQFRPVPHQSFPLASAENWRPNRLLIRIQPSEGILLSFQAKVPGLEVRLMPVNMEFCYQETFKTELPEAYETLLRDIIRGDATLFMRADQVEAAWSVVTPILSVWESESSMEFPNHAAGNWGPSIADEMLARDGYFWLPSSRPKGPSGFREFDPCVH